VGERMLATFGELYYWAVDKSIRTIIVAGDTFDKRLIEPKCVKALHLLLEMARSTKGMRFVFLSGNHDVDQWCGNALDYLPSTYCTRFYEPVKTRVYETGTHDAGGGADVLFIPFVPGKSAEESITEGLERQCPVGMGSPRVMVGHFGLYSDGAPVWQQQDPLSVHVDWVSSRAKKAGIQVVACGHYHNAAHFEVKGVDLYQIGSLSPRNFSETGLRFGNVLVVEGIQDGSLKCHHGLGVIAGVRYIDHIDQMDDTYTRELHGKSVLGRCWYLTRGMSENPLPKYATPTPSPDKLEDVIGGAWTVSDGATPQPFKDGVEVGPEGVSSIGAVGKYVRANLGSFSGPTAGLLHEAQDRLQGTFDGNAMTVAPDMRLLGRKL